MKSRTLFLTIVLLLLLGTTITFSADKVLEQYKQLINKLEKYKTQKLDQAEIKKIRSELINIQSQYNNSINSQNSKTVYTDSTAYESDDIIISDLLIEDSGFGLYQVKGFVKNKSHQCFDHLIINLHIFQNDSLVHTTPLFIQKYSYSYFGFLPFSTSKIWMLMEKVEFTSLQLDIDYSKVVPAAGDKFLCDQLLVLKDNNFEELEMFYSRWLNWSGCLVNAYNYFISYPEIEAIMYKNNQIVDTFPVYLDMPCQLSEKVAISIVTQKPDEWEVIYLTNCANQPIDISGWTLGNSITPKAYRIPQNTTINPSVGLYFDDLNFSILDENETIYLHDNEGNLVCTWIDTIDYYALAPGNNICFMNGMFIKNDFDNVQYEIYYDVQSLTGSGNIPPNLPKMNKLIYSTETDVELTVEFFMIDYNNDDMELTIDWGDGSDFTTQSGIASRSFPQFTHTYADTGTFYISAKASDDSSETQWSFGVPVQVTSSTTEIIADKSSIPVSFALQQNYPNPFNPSTTISYTVAEKSNVRLEVFDASGRLVTTLTNAEHQPGSYQLDWNAATHSSGVYLCRMTAGSYSSVRKMLLIK